MELGSSIREDLNLGLVSEEGVGLSMDVAFAKRVKSQLMVMIHCDWLGIFGQIRKQGCLRQ